MIKIQNMKSQLLNISLFLIATFLFGSCSQEQDKPDESFSIGEPELISDGYRFTEGPYWHPDGYLLFSDIPANRVYKWHPDEGSSVYLEPSGNSNGISADQNGRILLAQHAGRLSRVSGEKDMEVLAESYNGKRLNSPNDLTVHSNGTIYFTDPPFGVSDEERELEFGGVYKLTSGGDLELVYDDFTHPNGIVLSPDESKLYVNDSRTGDIVMFNADENGDISGPEKFTNIGAMGDKGGADGMKVDSNGNLYTTGPNGLIVFDPDGNRMETIEFDEQITNLAWGGPENRHLFLTASSNIYRFKTGIKGHKKM